MSRTWQDIEEIAHDLLVEYPEVEPLAVDLPQLRGMVLKLRTFRDEPDAASAETLEHIQASWYEQLEG